MDPAILHAAMWYLAFVFSTTCHEAAHAWTSWKLGDDTAHRTGLTTLNPLPHILYCPIGMVLAPLLMLFFTNGRQMMGWGQAPCDPFWADRYPRRAALFALAGPLVNLLIAAVAAIVLRVGLAQGWVGPGAGLLGLEGADPAWQAPLATGCQYLLLLNALLFWLNMIPLPPFDGAFVMMLLLPREVARAYQEKLRDPILANLGMLLALLVLPKFMTPVLAWTVSWAVFE